MKESLSSKFKLKDLGQIKNCLGMNVGVDKVNGTVTLNQENYVDQLLNRFDMVDCKVADTPLENKLNVKHYYFMQLLGIQDVNNC